MTVSEINPTRGGRGTNEHTQHTKTTKTREGGRDKQHTQQREIHRCIASHPLSFHRLLFVSSMETQRKTPAPAATSRHPDAICDHFLSERGKTHTTTIKSTLPVNSLCVAYPLFVLCFVCLCCCCLVDSSRRRGVTDDRRTTPRHRHQTKQHNTHAHTRNNRRRNTQPEICVCVVLSLSFC